MMDKPRNITGAQWLTEHLAAQNQNWAYVNGIVKFGDHHADIAREAAIQAGFDDNQADYVSNMVTRQQMPEGVNIAVGSLNNGRPQIFSSTVDRNHIWTYVMNALARQEFVRPS